MKTYRNIGGESGVVEYDYGTDWIRVRFNDGGLYDYTSASAGQAAIDTMKSLADAGEGLNAFINKNVRMQYARKES